MRVSRRTVAAVTAGGLSYCRTSGAALGGAVAFGGTLA